MATHSRPLAWLQAARAAATRHDATARCPFALAGRPAGSVAIRHLPLLAAWPGWFRVTGDGVDLVAPREQHGAVLASVNQDLRAQGHILAWRDEAFAVTALDDGEPLAVMERAACRFWGTLTLGAHLNGLVAGDAGRPPRLWVARRSAHKATDPGAWDNLVGGGVPHGQTPWQALQREAWEEAGMAPDLAARATAAGVLTMCSDVPQGLQREALHAFDVLLPPDWQPQNQDGEVQAFECLPLPQALDLAVSGRMTVDAAWVTLDLGQRLGLLA